MYQPYPPQPVYYGQQYSGCVKILLYVLSLWIPLAGVIIGIIFMSRPDPESKGLGKTCLILGIISFALTCCLSGLILALYFAGVLPILLEEFSLLPMLLA